MCHRCKLLEKLKKKNTLKMPESVYFYRGKSVDTRHIQLFSEKVLHNTNYLSSLLREAQ